MFSLKVNRWSLDAGLQIIHGEVRLEVDGRLLIDEPLCVDVGLPALLLSAIRDTAPDRWAKPEEWEKMPFFVCGCGDPGCRAHSFAVRHREGGTIMLTEVEERRDQPSRELGEYEVPSEEYRRAAAMIGKRFLDFAAPLSYHPSAVDTVRLAKELLARLGEG